MAVAVAVAVAVALAVVVAVAVAVAVALAVALAVVVALVDATSLPPCHARNFCRMFCSHGVPARGPRHSTGPASSRQCCIGNNMEAHHNCSTCSRHAIERRGSDLPSCTASSAP